jgi:hypothetical protein
MENRLSTEGFYITVDGFAGIHLDTVFLFDEIPFLCLGIGRYLGENKQEK